MTQPMADKPMSALEEIFPREIVEQADHYLAWDDSGHVSEVACNTPLTAVISYCNTLHAFDLFCNNLLVVHIGAFDAKRKAIIARCRIRLSLNVEVLDDQQGEG